MENKISYQDIIGKSIQFKSRKEFKKIFPDYYKEALEYEKKDLESNSTYFSNDGYTTHGLRIFAHMDISYDEVKNEALKYKCPLKFKISSQMFWHVANINNWYLDVTEHMFIETAKKKAIYAIEFLESKHVYIGQSVDIISRFKQHFIEKSIDSSVNDYFREVNEDPILKPLTNYEDSVHSVNIESFFVDFYGKNGWVILNRNTPSSIGGYSNEIMYLSKHHMLNFLLNNVKTRSEFKKKFYNLYKVANTHYWLEDICKTLEEKNKVNCNFCVKNITPVKIEPINFTKTKRKYEKKLKLEII